MRKTIITTAILGTILTGCGSTSQNLTYKQKEDKYQYELKKDENALIQSEEYQNASFSEKQRMMLNVKINSAKKNVRILR